MTDDDYDALSQKQLASIKRDMRISLEDAAVRATYKVMAELETEQTQGEEHMKPTAWLKELPPEEGNGMMMTTFEEVAKEWEEPVIPLYSKGAWVGLTDEEIQECLKGLPTQTIDVYARRIEAKLKEKNT